LWLKREGYSESTIRSRVKILKNIMKNCNIFDIDDFKTFLANTKWCDGTKQNNIDVYRCYAWCKGLKAENLPKYSRDYSLPFIPLEKEIDTLISGCGRKTSTFLQLLKETAFRPIEALRLRWVDFDTERKTINLTRPAKHSKPRQPKISSKLLSMLLSLSHNSKYFY
jgi:integrase